MKTATLISLLSIVLLLNACANINKSPACPKSTLGQCLSMGAVNDLIDQGSFEQEIQKNYRKKSQQQTRSLQFYDQAQVQDINNIPLRSGEKILQIWLAPYEDDAGNYVTGHSIFTVVLPASWGPPPPIQATPVEENRLTAIEKDA